MGREQRPWLVLGAVVTGQLMVGVDATVLSLAVPEMTADLQMSAESRAWVLAGYVLAAGSLMIAGGRWGQAVGYVRAMTVGLIIFAVASGVGGAAQDEGLLIAARVVQGVGAAVMTPAAMARLSAAFPGADRPRAYGVFGMIMGSGTAIGLLLGGALTQLLGWRACMYVNIAFVVVALILSALAHDRVPRSAGHARGWWRGTVLAAGAAAILQALTSAEQAPRALALGLAGVAVVALFVLSDRRAGTPLVPVVLFRDPVRRVAYLGLFVWGVATITTFVSASGSLQRDHDVAPLVVGVLFLVYPAAIQLGLAAARRLGSRPTTSSMGIGLALIGLGQATFALAPTALAVMLLALVLMGVGTSQVMPNANSAMNRDAGPHAGVAGAVGTTLQQVGGSVGLAAPVALSAVTTHATGVTAGLSAAALLLASLLAFRTTTAATSVVREGDRRQDPLQPGRDVPGGVAGEAQQDG